MDVTRVSDSHVATLRNVDKHIHPYKAKVGRLFSAGPLTSDPHNRCPPPQYTMSSNPLLMKSLSSL